MMQSPTAATVNPSATLIVSSRCGSRGAGAGGCWAAITVPARTRTDPTNGVRRMEASFGGEAAPRDASVVGFAQSAANPCDLLPGVVVQEGGAHNARRH